MKKQEKTFNVTVLKKATNEELKFANVTSINNIYTAASNKVDYLEITQLDKYYTSILDTRYFKIIKVGR